MENIRNLLEEVKKLSSSFEKHADKILKRLTDPDKTKLQLDLEVCQFYENIMQANQYLCEVKCNVLQMRHDLYNMKQEESKLDKKQKDEKKVEKEKLVLLLFNAEEEYEECKRETTKILDAIIEKSNKMKFTMEEIELWNEAQNFIKTNIIRMNA